MKLLLVYAMHVFSGWNDFNWILQVIAAEVLKTYAYKMEDISDTGEDVTVVAEGKYMRL